MKENSLSIRDNNLYFILIFLTSDTYIHVCVMITVTIKIINYKM